jgi:uracil-DNA glycosylase
MTTWTDILSPIKKEPYFQTMMLELKRRREAGIIIYPPVDQVFNAFVSTPFKHVKVVILGQDPYHGAGQAHGLSFSVMPNVKIPPSLVNIYKELNADPNVSFVTPSHGYLQSWAEQGVLLLNTVLTVEQGKAHSHAKLGWEAVTENVINALNAQNEHIVFLLWGAHAQKKGAKIDRTRHCVLSTVHPSPLSAYRGFLGCGHFSKTNEYLISIGKSPIEWQLPK